MLWLYTHKPFKAGVWSLAFVWHQWFYLVLKDMEMVLAIAWTHSLALYSPKLFYL